VYVGCVYMDSIVRMWVVCIWAVLCVCGWCGVYVGGNAYI